VPTLRRRRRRRKLMPKPKSDRWWGCPECGNRELIQKATFLGTRDVRLVGDRQPMAEEIDEEKRTIDDVDDYEHDYECMACGESFTEPARIVSDEAPDFRIELRLRGQVFETKKLKDSYRVEKELEDDNANTDRTISIDCSSREMAIQAVERIEKMFCLFPGVVK